MGAINKVAWGDDQMANDALDVLYDAARVRGVAHISDHEGHAAVLALYDRAIASLANGAAL